MAIDPDLLSAAKAAEIRLVEADYAADVARADFHRAVRRLQLGGGSLREIADALSLSHQRVHQIVAAAGGSRRWKQRPKDRELRYCSFCGKDQKHVKKLIVGPGVFICDECVSRVEAVLKTGNVTTTRTATLRPVDQQDTADKCSFCGKRRKQVPAMASAGDARICAECVDLCNEIVAEQLA
jgi:ClpX C4-type zinc finger